METIEHTSIGNLLRLTELNNNPYLRVDADGILYIKLQRAGEDGIPYPMDLEMSTGEIIAMAGDYFTEADWAVNVYTPSLKTFGTVKNLGNNLIQHPIKTAETDALIKAYNNLASPQVSRKHIEDIYAIDQTKYIPFSSSLNQYAQQLMFYFKVKNYGEMLNKNLTHFTPWSVRVYLLGHFMALKYAQIAYELRLLFKYPNYQSTDPEIQQLINKIKGGATTIEDMSHRYHAQALGIECFTFHYYSDHFAAGHMSMIGDLRVELTKRFGNWGSILVNNMHNELNELGVYTKKVYAHKNNTYEVPILAYGDNAFDNVANFFNKQNCIKGMQSSLTDLQATLKGEKPPTADRFAGLPYLPDVDYNSRQYQPLIILCKGRIYHRDPIDEIQLLAPSEYEKMRANPKAHGYKLLDSAWEAFKLVFKLRVMPYLYTPKVIALSTEQLFAIEQDELARTLPMRKPATTHPIKALLPDWRKPYPIDLNQVGLFSEKRSALENLISLDEYDTLEDGFSTSFE